MSAHRTDERAWARAALASGVLTLACAAFAIGCGALLGLGDLKDLPDEAGLGGEGGADGGQAGPGDLPNLDAVGATTANKIDILLVVDDSSGMADKSKILAAKLDPFLRKAAALTNDVHLGVIATSLGTIGGNICADTEPQNARAHLSTRGTFGDVPSARTNGFISYVGGRGGDAVDLFVLHAQQLVLGVGEDGCGLEAQLESTYRFLMQPDPWATIAVANDQASYVGLDKVLLAQRKAFLRPDSFVLVLLLSDEDDSSVDPRSVGGLGWAYANTTFPGSKVTRPDGKTTTAPRGTSACATNPASPDCTSCVFAASCDAASPACTKIKNDPECKKNGGFYGAFEEALNVRFQNMKRRFGVDPQFPLSRYVNAFSKQRVPNRDGEHVLVPDANGGGMTVSEYLGKPTCTNPLFAAALPDPDGELCNLPLGPRGKQLVSFMFIGGLPQTLGSAADFPKLVGANPDAFDVSGQDAHMIQSTQPRPGLPVPSDTRGDYGSDPIHGREWTTGGTDLQYACTFVLDAVRMCTAAETSCDCAGASNPPLCGPTFGDQTRAKAYPSIREIRVAHEAGAYGSICNSPTAYASFIGKLSALLDVKIAK